MFSIAYLSLTLNPSNSYISQFVFLLFIIKGTFSPQQKYNTINQQRQKLMREQYFIDVLVKILEEVMRKQEFEELKRIEDERKREIERIEQQKTLS